MNSLQSILRGAKRMVLPEGKAFRRIKFGPAAGRIMNIDLQYELRILLGVYERELIPHYRMILKPGMKSFDVGGRDGYSALLIGSITNAEVVSFECESSSASEMRGVFEQNDLPIRAVQAYVGNKIDDLSTTLDAAADNYFKPDFIKMDVEGAELDVLRGASKILSLHKPALIVEVHGKQTELECLDILAGHSYKPFVVEQARFLRENRPLSHNRWLICHAD